MSHPSAVETEKENVVLSPMATQEYRAVTAMEESAEQDVTFLLRSKPSLIPRNLSMPCTNILTVV